MEKSIIDIIPQFFAEALLIINERCLRIIRYDQSKTNLVNNYVGVLYLTVLLTILEERLNTNYLSNTNKYQPILSDEHIRIIQELLIIPKSLISKVTDNFDKNLEQMKLKHNLSSQFKLKKLNHPLFACVLISGINLHFLMNLLKFIIKQGKVNGPFLEYFTKVIDYNPMILDKFRNLDNENILLLMILNPNKTEMLRELKQITDSNQIIKINDNELSNNMTEIKFADVFNYFKENSFSTIESSSSSEMKIFLTKFFRNKKEIMNNFLSAE